ncbi:MAG: RidA family protein, partial [Phycisphaeraceae bacterium]
MDIEANLKKLGIELPEAPSPIASYVPAKRSGKQLYISGQLPLHAGKLVAMGSVPTVVTPELAQEAARRCTINALAILRKQVAGDWSKVVGA